MVFRELARELGSGTPRKAARPRGAEVIAVHVGAEPLFGRSEDAARCEHAGVADEPVDVGSSASRALHALLARDVELQRHDARGVLLVAEESAREVCFRCSTLGSPRDFNLDPLYRTEPWGGGKLRAFLDAVRN